MGLFSKSKKEDNNIQPKGRFIVIDGTDGTGKTTQINLLAKTLEVSGYDHTMFDFPQYKTHSAAMLERYLSGEYGQLNPEAASILYAIDRFDASFKIREMMNQNKIILTNRYVTSNAGHQGGKIEDPEKRIKFYKWLDNLEHGTFSVPKPDLTVILHVPVEMSIELIKKGHEAKGTKPDLHDQDIEHLKKAEKVYMEIAELFPNTRLIECAENGQMLSPNAIHSKIWEIVRRITLKDIEPQLVK